MTSPGASKSDPGDRLWRRLPTGLRTLLVFALLVAAALGLLRARGYRLTLESPHGDRSQSEAVHLGSLGGETSPPSTPAGAGVRNVVLVIADGLGFSHVHAARAQIVGLAGRLYFERLPVTGWMTTSSSENLITDSASSATSLATGSKVPVGVVSLAADGAPLPTIAEAASRSGLAVGLVTDSYLWDATPAAFAAHVASRSAYDRIAADMAGAGFPLLVGERVGGDDVEERRLDQFRRRGARVVGSWEELRSILPTLEPLVALLPSGSIEDPTIEPRPRDLARLALDRLALDADGFFLVFETEETDTGSHRRDLRRVTAAIAALEEVMREVVAFAAERNDTLVLLTSDHETGGLTLLWGEEGEPLGIRWAGGHTGQPVPLYAFGPGAERFSGVLDNTEIPRRLAALLGLDLFTDSPGAASLASPAAGAGRRLSRPSSTRPDGLGEGGSRLE